MFLLGLVSLLLSSKITLNSLTCQLHRAELTSCSRFPHQLDEEAAIAEIKGSGGTVNTAGGIVYAVNFGGCKNIDFNSLVNFKALKDLEALDMENSNISNTFIDVIAEMKSLKTLDISGTNLKSQDIEKIGLLTNLVIFRCNRTKINAKSLNTILENNPKISVLVLGDSPALTEIPKSLESLKSLYVLNMNGYKLSVSESNRLCSIPAIGSLYLSDCGLTDMHLTNLGKVQVLNYLDLSNNRINRRTLQTISRMNDLEDLNISGCDLVSLFELRFDLLGHLREVNLSRNPVTDNDIDNIMSAKNLKELSLAHTRITDRSLIALSMSRYLQYINVSSCNISDSGVKYLNKMPSLKMIDLSHTDVGDNSVTSLFSLLQLSELNLSHTKITNKSMDTIINKKLSYTLHLKDTAVSDMILINLRRTCSIVEDHK